MPDRDSAPDPVDTAYLRAEALLDDESAQAARRERVLRAVSGEAAARGSKLTSAPRQRHSWRGGRWLAAASVAGLATFVALRLEPTREVRHTPSTVDSRAESAESSPVGGVAPETAESTPAPAPPSATVAPDVVAEAQARSSTDAVTDASPARPLAQPPAPPALAPAAPAAAVAESAAGSDAAATGDRVDPPPAAARARALPSAAAVGTTAAAPAASAARLRAAAAAGRVAELTALLDQGALVDEPDAAGETALMKSVQANQPHAAALLRRRGASLDRENAVGASAREMAAAIGDPELNRALGLP